jgi:hypothetical protein
MEHMTIVRQIREGRQLLVSGDHQAAKELMSQAIANLDVALSTKRSSASPDNRTLRLVRRSIAKAGRAILTCDFALAAVILEEAGRALESQSGHH